MIHNLHTNGGIKMSRIAIKCFPPLQPKLLAAQRKEKQGFLYLVDGHWASIPPGFYVGTGRSGSSMGPKRCRPPCRSRTCTKHKMQVKRSHLSKMTE